MMGDQRSFDMSHERKAHFQRIKRMRINEIFKKTNNQNQTMSRPFVWQMIKEAIDYLNGRASYSEVKDYINTRWDGVNENTINAQIIVSTVNHPSRIHYPENKKPRISNGQYDFLYTTGRGQVVAYNPEEHGIWEIYKNEFDGMGVRQQSIEDDPEPEVDAVSTEDRFLFPIEANLRDFLIQNLKTVRNLNLQLFVDEQGRDGKEYPTAVGPIDILARDERGNFYVFELKLSKGPDKALGQILRYMGWIKKEMAKDKAVKGIIVANKMDDKIKYAVSVTPDVSLYEYELKFEVRQLSVI
jgi:hypothetical protein